MYKFFVLFALLFAFQNDTNEISWNANHQLTWADFQGKPQTNTDAVAITASGITFGYSIEKSSTRGVIGFKTQIFAHFYPEHSWCKKEIVDDHVLAHEQLHFDITELHARYFREKVSKIKINNTVANTLNDLQNQTNTNLAAMQDHYDNESNYSMNKEGQTKWQLFIKKELKRMQNFKAKH